MVRRRLDRGNTVRIAVRPRDVRTTAVSVRGELDLCSSFPVAERLSSLDAETTRLILDLSELRFIVSAGIGMFLTVAHRWMLLSAEPRVVAQPGRIRSVLKTAGLDRAVGVHPTVADAVSGPDGTPA